jgi:hypothetical protein
MAQENKTLCLLYRVAFLHNISDSPTAEKAIHQANICVN